MNSTLIWFNKNRGILGNIAEVYVVTTSMLREQLVDLNHTIPPFYVEQVGFI